jgi:hypothetical protein
MISNLSAVYVNKAGYSCYIAMQKNEEICFI